MSADREALLRAHIEAAQGAPVIGIDDCGPWVMAWIETATGRRIAFPAYATRQQGYRLAARAGGLANLAAPLMAAAGLAATVNPQLGDVAVIALGGRDLAAIVCRGGLVAVRGEAAGVVFHCPQPDQILAAWGLP